MLPRVQMRSGISLDFRDNSVKIRLFTPPKRWRPSTVVTNRLSMSRLRVTHRLWQWLDRSAKRATLQTSSGVTAAVTTDTSSPVHGSPGPDSLRLSPLFDFCPTVPSAQRAIKSMVDTDCCDYFQWWCHTPGSWAAFNPDIAGRSGTDSQQSV
jgi:hypothetical protein